jgi:hypothetical protein
LERIFKQYLNRAEPVLPGTAPEQGPADADANQQVDHPDRSVLRLSSGPHFSSAYRNFFGATPREDRNQRRSSSPFELSSVPSERG